MVSEPYISHKIALLTYMYPWIQNGIMIMHKNLHKPWKLAQAYFQCILQEFCEATLHFLSMTFSVGIFSKGQGRILAATAHDKKI